ncbi:hypothetical protein B0T18DRAFT_249223 [Schizothecium vesticola]|uniref:Uncharacterized protein n=1 Tax=Schizothecium vesticola TaxID=314040 RepID=A0AA40BQH7_9PEZI|nr:hypothetical protein B0T18DRAFT_249223 [Schizothecium vesticola]
MVKGAEVSEVRSTHCSIWLGELGFGIQETPGEWCTLTVLCVWFGLITALSPHRRARRDWQSNRVVHAVVVVVVGVVVVVISAPKLESIFVGIWMPRIRRIAGWPLSRKRLRIFPPPGQVAPNVFSRALDFPGQGCWLWW